MVTQSRKPLRVIDHAKGSTKRPARCSTRHTLQEWNSIRARFQELYQSDAYTLAQIRDLFKKEGFDATERQYKRKVELWKLAKKLKSKEKRFMVLKAAQRLSQYGKQTTFYHNGREVKQGRLTPVRKMLAEQDSGEPQLLSTPSNIVYRTPQMRTLSADSTNPVDPPLDADSKPLLDFFIPSRAARTTPDFSFDWNFLAESDKENEERGTLFEPPLEGAGLPPLLQDPFNHLDASVLCQFPPTSASDDFSSWQLAGSNLPPTLPPNTHNDLTNFDTSTVDFPLFSDDVFGPEIDSELSMMETSADYSSFDEFFGA